MTQNTGVQKLVDLLADYYPSANDARSVIIRAGIPAKFIDFNGSSIVIWTHIFQEAEKRNKLADLIATISQDYSQIDWSAIQQDIEQPINYAPVIGKDIPWKGDEDLSTLEKIIERQSTLMPISFLEKGLLMARSIAKVKCNNGSGTGFLIRDNLFITNHHVIPNIKMAEKATLQFNFQKTIDGQDAQSVIFNLAPDKGFATSPLAGGDDWTAVRVEGNANADWGAIELIEIEAKVSDYVNIIQHPEGKHKQIALYHNTVAYADQSRVQYLTDTLPGSSGSPVFNSDWHVVALHHSGGNIKEPNSQQSFFRNEGIAINILIAALEANGL